ncbi:MAG: hypothetical protein AABX38_00630 [Candidatus Micrarchaeota archaeon]
MSPLKEFGKFPVQLFILFLTLLAYVLTQNLIFGILVAFEFVVFLGFEFSEGTKQHGLKHEIIDTVIALVFALSLWLGLSLALNTSSPLSAVVSCSMLPNLDRGDMVLIQGATINSFEQNISKSEIASLTSENVVAYYANNLSSFAVKGSIYAYCSFNVNPVCLDFIKSPQNFYEMHGDLRFNYKICEVNTASGVQKQPCVSSASYKGTQINFDNSRDIIVFQPAKEDIYARSGDIIHRAQIKLNENGKYYYLTKGDNNPVFDIQVYDYLNGAGNLPVEQSRVKGKTLIRVPYLGYFKLFLSGFFNSPAQCKTQLIN